MWLNKTYGQLKEEIKKEARVKGSDEIDQFILDTVNELLAQETSKNRHFELFIPDYPLSLSDGSRAYDMPSDFQHLKEVRFARDGTNFIELHDRNVYRQKVRNSGLPKFYELAGSSIRLYPFEEITSDMALEMDYYRAPVMFDSTSDTFPVPKLYNVVKRDAIARTHLYYKEYQAAQAFSGGAAQADNETVTANEVK